MDELQVKYINVPYQISFDDANLNIRKFLLKKNVETKLDVFGITPNFNSSKFESSNSFKMKKPFNEEKKVETSKYLIDNSGSVNTSITQAKTENFLLNKKPKSPDLQSRYIPSSHNIIYHPLDNYNTNINLNLKEILNEINNITSKLLDVQKNLILYSRNVKS